MKIILIGGPASGKGVQAKMICEKYNLIHISTGELLRDEIKKNTPFSMDIKEKISNGALISDDIVCNLVKNKVEESKGMYLLDGFPRTLKQAQMFYVVDIPDAVIFLETDYEVALSRLMKRRICLNCKATLNVDELKNGHCPICSGTVAKRVDDEPDVFKKRHEIYKMQSAPLIKFYDGKCPVIWAKNNSTIDDTFENIDKQLVMLDK